MRAASVLAILCLLVVGVSQASVVRTGSDWAGLARANLAVGSVLAGDRLLLRQYLIRSAVPNTIQSEDLIYRGNTTTRISAIFATEQGSTQYATAWILNGGVGRNNVTIRVQSYRGYGYYYLVDVYGR